MNQITFKELKEFCGYDSNNDFANFVSLLLDDSEKVAESKNSKIGTEYAKLQRKKSFNIYAKLKELGYYDDVKEV